MTNRWGNSGNSDRLYLFGVQNHGDGDFSHDIKGHLLLGRKVMTNLDSILKSRDITLPTKEHLVQATVFQWSWMGVQVCCSFGESYESDMTEQLNSTECKDVRGGS